MHDPNCVFCKIIAGAIPSAKVFESENVLAFLDIQPMEKGHVLVIPKRHWPTLMDVPVEIAEDIACFEELMYIVRVAAKAVRRDFADGVNILQCNGPGAGQTVSHLHFHVIPRYGSDAVQPAWQSGHGRYANDAERADYAKRIAAAIATIIKEEDLIG
ncbi:MAG: HIT family protein [Kiritimatiellia bacterium]|jgi:histidine triad (HIT) family protein